MFKGLVFFVKQGWKYDKCYILWRTFYQITNSLIPIVATIMPKFIIDELLVGRNVAKLVMYVGILAGYTLFATALSHFFSWDGFTRRCRVSAAFDVDLHNRLYKSDFECLESTHFLDMQEKAKKFLYCDWHGFGYLLDCAMNIIGQFITLLGIAAIMITFDWKIVIMFMIFIIISAKVEGNEKKKSMKLSQQIIKEQRGWMYYAGLFDDFSYGKEIRINCMGDWLLTREKEYLNCVNNNTKRQNSHYIKAGVWGAFFTFLQQIIAYGYLAYCIFNHTISIGEFTMYVGAVSTFAVALKSVITSLTEIGAYDMYYDDLDEYLSIPTKLREGKRLDITSKEYTFEFRNVSFRYQGSDKYALRNVNLTLRSGQKLSIVGENGAGKTTFVKLLTRLYDPTEGEILLNGVNIKEIDYDHYMSIFSTVYQDYKLFSLSIVDNVALALPVDRERIQKVLEQVGFGEKLKKLPSGIDTSIYKNFDESGFEPSGGEGQKIALARALYKNAPVVIMDEPTAALDPRAEYEIYQLFNELVNGKSAVYISHRLSSTRFCDVIAVFSNGEIIEYGSHDELMRNNGLYHELYEMQAQFYI